MNNYLDRHPGVIKANAQERYFGAPIGILLLDEVAPFVPGSVGHAGTFSQPVRYRTVRGVTFERILQPNADECEALFVEAAVELAKEGARMITANCGFTARFQRAVSNAVDAPVLLSSLMLIPFLERMLPASRTLGIVTASAGSLTTAFLSEADLMPHPDRFVVAGLDDAPAFNAAFVSCIGEADIPAIASEVVDSAVALLRRRPDVGALLLECSELPPYASAVQKATGVPVFDFTSLIEFFAGGLSRSPFEGFM